MRKFQVTVNGNSYEVDVLELTGGGVSAPVAQPVIAEKVAEPVLSSVGDIKVEAPMQGKIVDVKVSEGDKVNPGDVIAILEAMKMENEVVAPSAGVIASINVATGQSVNAGDVIASLN